MAFNKVLEDKVLQDIEALIPIEERWENLTLANDFMFSTVMSDEALCTEMMRRILPDIEIEYISIPEAQKTLRGALESKSVRFDLYTKSDDGKIYDIEIQTTNNKDLPRRSRAYHILMGDDVLRRSRGKSKRYRDIPDSYVIFICMFDPFELGRYIYTFKNICSEAKALDLGDGAFTIFLNAKGKTGKISKKLKAFLDFLRGKETPGDAFIEELAKRLRFAKLDPEGRRIHMYNWLYESTKIENAKEEAREAALAEARAEAQAAVAKAQAEARAEAAKAQAATAKAQAATEKAQAATAEAQAATAKAPAEEKARFSKFTEDLTAKLHAAGLPLETIANVIASSMKAVQAQA
ncbi:MAG: Rpn family recombination-promoting nuclease/putative transposase [Synergistaceae bacterium]|nr:Rpn family recombination-promoting nuclease/putative transposase [Synergistaceae bacterium]